MNQTFQPTVARGDWPGTYKASLSWTNHIVNGQRTQRTFVNIFLDITNRHKIQPGQKSGGNFLTLSKKSALQMLGYLGLDDGSITSHVRGDAAVQTKSAEDAADWLLHFKLGDNASLGIAL